MDLNYTRSVLTCHAPGICASLGERIHGGKRDRRVMWECSLSHIIHQSEQRAGMGKCFYLSFFIEF